MIALLYVVFAICMVGSLAGQCANLMAARRTRRRAADLEVQFETELAQFRLHVANSMPAQWSGVFQCRGCGAVGRIETPAEDLVISEETN